MRRGIGCVCDSLVEWNVVGTIGTDKECTGLKTEPCHACFFNAGVGVPIHIESGGAARKHCFGKGGTNANANVTGGHDFCFGGKELAEKGLKVDIIGEAAERRHREVSVRIDQTWHNNSASRIDGVINYGCWLDPRREHLSNGVVGNDDGSAMKH